MSTFEKLFSIISLCCLLGLTAVLFYIPAARSISILLPLGFVAILFNAGLLFIVFKDIFTRPFPSDSKRYFWALLIFFFIPAVLVYLPKYGFKPKESA